MGLFESAQLGTSIVQQRLSVRVLVAGRLQLMLQIADVTSQLLDLKKRGVDFELGRGGLTLPGLQHLLHPLHLVHRLLLRLVRFLQGAFQPLYLSFLVTHLSLGAHQFFLGGLLQRGDFLVLFGQLPGLAMDDVRHL